MNPALRSILIALCLMFGLGSLISASNTGDPLPAIGQLSFASVCLFLAYKLTPKDA